MRYAISSNEEVWVRACNAFFENHGTFNWYEVPKDQALREMFIYSNGTANPKHLKDKIDSLYQNVGVK